MMELKDIRKQLANLEKDDILKVFGMEERRTTMDVILPAVGLFSVGLLVGAGLGLLLAPKSGRELRDDLRNRLQSGDQHGPQGEIGPAAKIGQQATRTA